MFHHTQNENGTFNTLCLYCFMTVASAVESNEEIEKVEASHMCPEHVLSELHLLVDCDCECMRPN
jgi:hypothetical protein